MLDNLKNPFANSEQINRAILLLRLVGGGFMLTHGVPKLMKLLAGDFQFADPFGIGPAFTLGLAVFAEFVCAIMILVGFRTRFAALPLIITMLVAAFMIHGADPFGKKELALIYLFIYLIIFYVGSGKYSMDAKLMGKED